jgi:hypothetical protein
MRIGENRFISNDNRDIKKDETLTTGGGFSLEKGVGTLEGRRVNGSLSKRCATSRSISAWVSVVQIESLSDQSNGSAVIESKD